MSKSGNNRQHGGTIRQPRFDRGQLAQHGEGRVLCHLKPIRLRSGQAFSRDLHIPLFEPCT